MNAAGWFAASSFHAPVQVREVREERVTPTPSCASCRDRGHVVDRIVGGQWVSMNVGCLACGHRGDVLRLDAEDEVPCEVALLDFLDANADGLDAEELTAIASLGPGESFSGGGGAAPAWRVTRIGGAS